VEGQEGLSGTLERSNVACLVEGLLGTKTTRGEDESFSSG
jgi:hypothetical protein